jgi:hypothetical protein
MAADRATCDKSSASASSSTIVFASHGDVLAGLYLGSNIDAASAVRELSKAVTDAVIDSGLGEARAAQTCGANLTGAYTMGLIATRAGSKRLLQQAVQSWANATCVEGFHHATESKITIAQLPPTVIHDKRSDIVLESRANTCRYVLVVSGDSCASLATECGITATQLSEYNPSSTLCSTLAVGQPICCSAGSLPDLRPQPNADGTCYSYTVQQDDYCALLAEKNYITIDEIETYNAQTWGWMGCSNLQLGSVICLSSGDPPMPAVMSNAACGPQVVGTTRPSDWANISNLNPCPLNACVSLSSVLSPLPLSRLSY